MIFFQLLFKTGVFISKNTGLFGVFTFSISYIFDFEYLKPETYNWVKYVKRHNIKIIN